jgi:hypothetical protein
MIFPGWTPVTEGFGYTAEANSVSYTGRWIVPCTAANLQLALRVIDCKDRFAARKLGGPAQDYVGKKQIVQTLLSALTAQKMSFKILDTYAPNTMNADGTSVDSNSGINTLENADLAEVSVEWMQEPANTLGLNCCWVMMQGSGEFVEIGESNTIAAKFTANGVAGGAGSAYSNGTFAPLNKPMPRVDSKDVIRVEYPWVDASLVNLSTMVSVRGTVNRKDISIWAAGTLLYLGSDIEYSMSPLGYDGYKVTHNFESKPQDWNLIDAPMDVRPTESVRSKYPGATSDLMAWSSMAPVITNGVASGPINNSHIYRSYNYQDFTNLLFYYGVASTAPKPPVTIAV